MTYNKIKKEKENEFTTKQNENVILGHARIKINYISILILFFDNSIYSIKSKESINKTETFDIFVELVFVYSLFF